MQREMCYDISKNNSYFICSKCGCYFRLIEDECFEPTIWIDGGIATIPNYCPNCGAKIVNHKQEIENLKDENFKLRKLVYDMRQWSIGGCNKCPVKSECAKSTTCIFWEQHISSRMRELGI